MRNAVTMASVPADEEWVRGRIATLLAHYFLPDMPKELAGAVADDWVAAIMADPCPPAWAIQNACVAWLGGDQSRRKPTPGDIRALVQVELMWVYDLKNRLFLEDHPRSRAWHPLAKRLPPPEEPEMSPEMRAKIAKLLKDWGKDIGNGK